MFGGYLQLPTDFWALAGQPGGGALPSVHAAVGYSVFSLYFAGWALNNRRLRWLGLASGLILGSFFGALRILQGAHFLSQILWRSEEHTSELQSLMRISYAVFCLKKKNTKPLLNKYPPTAGHQTSI